MSARDELATVIGAKLDGIFGNRDFGPATQDFALADALLAEYVLVRRRDMPATHVSEYGNGVCTALAQEFYQPQLRYSENEGDKPGQWNRNIAYANLAVALAVESPEPTA
jgi:hypothetical protein